ncbi:MCE family protein [Nocardioides marmoriginsengisoli]|uniref:MCE family protein n=1 Tax=Nocardioides marmoriginsengisoli TaxID=661483 RepID=A0A3N0CNE6_9ACTN|nr:MlaD family protein [Nocardioides marmoriginsengisoli]RNL64821.1 MCE family protein [Nocardioides marmoriginsengisoli]
MNVAALLRDRLWQSLFGVLIVLVLTVAYLFNSVLDTPLIRGTKTVKVEMASTGGLFEGSAVTYRGIKVGKVRTIELSATGVVATVVITADDDIPVKSVAKVRSLSPVGEQYLDFQPSTRSGPYLKDGSVVPATATDLPKTLASTVIAVNKVLDQVDAGQLHTLLTELSTGLAGTGGDLGKLVDQGQVLLTDLDRLWPETERLLTNGSTVLDIGTSKAADIRQLAVSSKQFAAFLKNYDPELRRQLKQAPAQIDQLRALVQDASRILPAFLGQALTFSDLFRSYAPHLSAILTGYASGLGVLGKAVKDGQLLITGIPQRPTKCIYDTPRRDPMNPVRRPLVDTARCPDGTKNLQRGADHAPGPVR